MLKIISIIRGNLINHNRLYFLNIISKISFSTDQTINKIIDQSTSHLQQDQNKLKQNKIIQNKQKFDVDKRSTSLEHGVADKITSFYQTTDNQAERIEFHLFQQQYLPNFISKYIEKSTIINNIKQFNPYLANGGQNFEQFPLIKLITVGMKYISQDNIKIQTFKKLQYFIKMRLHNCTIQQNMKILYIMLKSFPTYRFNYNFIFSICLSLKRQLSLMHDSQLKTLFYILSTNKYNAKRYSHPLLIDLQQLILMRVIERFEKTNNKQKDSEAYQLKIQNMYEWIYYSLGLGLRNNYSRFVFQTKAKQLLLSYNKRCEIISNKEQIFRKRNSQNIIPMLQFMNILDKIIKYLKNYKSASINRLPKQIITLKQQFFKAKATFLQVQSKILQNMIRNGVLENRLKIFRIMIEDIDIKICQNLFQGMIQNDNSINKLENGKDTQYNAVNILFHELMKQSSYIPQITLQKIKILVALLDKRVIESNIAKMYFQTLNLPSQPNGLDMIYQIVKLQLFLFTFSQQFKPRSQSTRLILHSIKNQKKIYRQFDWLIFNYLNLLLRSNLSTHQNNIIGNTIPSTLQDSSFYSNEILSLLSKVIGQIKDLNMDKILDYQRQFIKDNKEIKELQKFFIQIKVHQMVFLDAILQPFYRIPHFSNRREKIAINSCNDDNINHTSLLLQKKLMNSFGWKVINLNTKKFSYLSINEKLKIISHQLSSQQQLISIKSEEVNNSLLQTLKLQK